MSAAVRSPESAPCGYVLWISLLTVTSILTGASWSSASTLSNAQATLAVAQQSTYQGQFRPLLQFSLVFWDIKVSVSSRTTLGPASLAGVVAFGVLAVCACLLLVYQEDSRGPFKQGKCFLVKGESHQVRSCTDTGVAAAGGPSETSGAGLRLEPPASSTGSPQSGSSQLHVGVPVERTLSVPDMDRMGTAAGGGLHNTSGPRRRRANAAGQAVGGAVGGAAGRNTVSFLSPARRRTVVATAHADRRSDVLSEDSRGDSQIRSEVSDSGAYSESEATSSRTGWRRDHTATAEGLSGGSPTLLRRANTCTEDANPKASARKDKSAVPSRLSKLSGALNKFARSSAAW
jgi:hypothetical protein